MKVMELARNIAGACFLIFISLLSIAVTFFSVYRDPWTAVCSYQIFPLDSFMVLVILIIIYLFLRKKNFFNLKTKYLLIIFLIFAFMLGLYWILSNPQELKELADEYNVLTTAKNIVKGDYGGISYKSYINTYPNNCGLLTIDIILFILFGQYVTTAFRLLNLILMLLGYLALYEITKYLYKNEDILKNLIFIFFLTPQFIFYIFFVYGNVMSYSIGMWSVFFFLIYLYQDKLKDLIVAFILITISIFIKNNSLIILIAELIFLFVKAINNQKYKQLLFIPVMLMMFYLSTEGVIKFYENISDTSYDNRLPKICWIAYGLNYDPRGPGGYFNEFEVYHHANDYVSEYTKLQTKQFIDGVLTAFKEHPGLIPRFYAQKFLVSWANPEFEDFNQYANLEIKGFNYDLVFGKSHELFYSYTDGAQTFVVLALFYYFYSKYRDITFNELLLAVIVLGGFFFHAFWEVKAIYLFQYYLFLLPYAAKGLSLISGHFSIQKNKK